MIVHDWLLQADYAEIELRYLAIFGKVKKKKPVVKNRKYFKENARKELKF